MFEVEKTEQTCTPWKELALVPADFVSAWLYVLFKLLFEQDQRLCLYLFIIQAKGQEKTVFFNVQRICKCIQLAELKCYNLHQMPKIRCFEGL